MTNFNGVVLAEELTLTPASLELFRKLANDAPNWNGTVCWGANFEVTKADEGNLTDLKKNCLVETFRDEGCVWVAFTAQGEAFAKLHGFSL